MSTRRRIFFTVFALLGFAAQLWLSDDWGCPKIVVLALFLVSFLGSLIVATHKKKAPLE